MSKEIRIISPFYDENVMGKLHEDHITSWTGNTPLAIFGTLERDKCFYRSGASLVIRTKETDSDPWVETVVNGEHLMFSPLCMPLTMVTGHEVVSWAMINPTLWIQHVAENRYKPNRKVEYLLKAVPLGDHDLDDILTQEYTAKTHNETMQLIINNPGVYGELTSYDNHDMFQQYLTVYTALSALSNSQEALYHSKQYRGNQGIGERIVAEIKGIKDELFKFDPVTGVNGGTPGVIIGQVIDYAGTTVPDQYLEANGSEVSRIIYSGLFESLGVTHGDGDGSTTFNLPNITSSDPNIKKLIRY